jgi:quercetin dioxygenase-like cupin family protein
LGLALAAAAAVTPATLDVTPAQAASAKVDVLAKSTESWNGKPYTAYPAGQPELTVLKFVIPANTSLPWHTHPFPNAAYILSGQITVEDRATGKTQTYHAGQAFAESVDAVHRGTSGSDPVVLIVTHAGVPGVPTFTPVPGEKAEY